MYRLTDHFCGMGGSSAGATSVKGVVLTAAANHWKLALDVHNANHPEAMHTQADLSVINPAFFPYTELAWFSPSCPGHSQARGVQDDRLEDSMWGESLPVEAAARSRATMWDVVRFAEHHRYLAVIVENVIEVAKWGPNRDGRIFENWLTAMGNLGYDHEIVCLNSMHAQDQGLPAPQSRDRLYVVFWRTGNRRPNLDAVRSPGAWCGGCEKIVRTVQWWKRPGNKVGRYRQQYLYRCTSCTGIVEPYWIPASSIIDWDLAGERIGDRAKPLAAKTRARIAVGIARYWGPLLVQHGGHQYDAADPKHVSHMKPDAYYRVRPVTDPVPVLDTSISRALAVPVEGREGKKAAPVEEPLRTQTARNETGLAFVTTMKGSAKSQIESSACSPAEPLRTVAASGNHHGLVTPYYGTSNGAKSTEEAMGTITATDRWALLTSAGGTWDDTTKPASEPVRTLTTRESTALVMRNNGGGAEMTTPVTEPIRTLTTAGHQSVLTAEDIALAAEYVDEVRFRMFEPHECKGAMAFTEEYVIFGSKRERVRMCGNAVTPPVARDLVFRVVESLEGVA